MELKAKMSCDYRWRRGLLAAVLIGWAGWSLYDGAVAYPEQSQRAEAFRLLRDSDEPDWTNKWQQTARQRGYPIDDPGRPHSQQDIITQYIYVAITLPAGLFCAWSFVRSFRRWIGADEHCLLDSSGRCVPFDTITGLNLDRWDRKGIAIVLYDSADGLGKFVLDDWKYERAATRALVERVQNHLKSDEQ